MNFSQRHFDTDYLALAILKFNDWVKGEHPENPLKVVIDSDPYLGYEYYIKYDGEYLLWDEELTIGSRRAFFKHNPPEKCYGVLLDLAVRNKKRMTDGITA